jgi:competence protein ComEC
VTHPDHHSSQRGDDPAARSLMAIWFWPFRTIANARGTLFAWVPVSIGTGVGLWFALPWEPGVWFYALVAITLCAGVALRLWGPELSHAPAVVLFCLSLGALAAGARAHALNAPTLDFRYYGPITGRIVDIDRSQTDALRLLLDQVVLDDTAVERTPVRVRVSLQGDWPLTPWQPGQIVMTTGHLSAPPGPTEPGAFDFRRMAYFDQLGAVGYTRTPVMLWAEPVGQAQIVGRWRTYLSNAIMAALPGDSGAFASGVMTGDRSGLSLDAVAALRDSSLAHLLAISGMNMAFLTAFVFGLLRYGIALVPPIALRVNSKKAAAVVALGVAFFYLLLSGSNVATERAFIMVTVMLGAILLDRRALTLRSVSLSAVLILIWQPESLLEPGFQMSYAATVALIAGFGAVDRQVMRQKLPRWAIPVFTLVLSSLLGGFATAPYAAAHFNRFAEYGLLANLLTVPVMGAIVMPAGAVAALLAPVGLAGPALWVMDMGSRWILFIAHWIAGLDGSVTAIPSPGPWVLPLVTLGGIWVIVWKGRGRWLGFAPLVTALGLWIVADRPIALIDEAGGMVGVMGPSGRALSAPKGAGFSVKNWLENDGDLIGQEGAAEREGFAGPKGARSFQLAGWSGVVLTGQAAADSVPDACASMSLVVIADWIEQTPDGCLVLDKGKLAETGAIAIWQDGEKGLLLEPTHKVRRLWSPPTGTQDNFWLSSPKLQTQNEN